MKAIQVTLDEGLLRRLAESPEVQERGRSEVVRRALDEYLRRREAEEIAQQYRRAYGNTDELDEELNGWAREGVWPET